MLNATWGGINMTRVSTDKEINLIVRDKVRIGWRIKPGKKHRKLVSPGGRWVSIPGTPSDRRAAANFRSDINRISCTV